MLIKYRGATAHPNEVILKGSEGILEGHLEIQLPFCCAPHLTQCMMTGALYFMYKPKTTTSICYLQRNRQKNIFFVTVTFVISNVLLLAELFVSS